jgi:phosphate/sulfate permease
VAATFVMIHLGFMKDDISLTGRPKPFLTRENLWLVNASLGIVGGVLCGYKRFLIAILTGLLSSLAITLATLFYLSFRESIFMAEIIIPLLAGLIGVFLYQYLNEKFPKNKQE